MDNIEKIYLICAVIEFASLAFIFVRLIMSREAFFKSHISLIGASLLTILIYSFFIFSRTYQKAMLFDGLYFICTDWLCLSMLTFIVFYCKVNVESKIIWKIATCLCAIDSISLFINNWTRHSFDLSAIQIANEHIYWLCEFKWPHYLHLAWCYTMIAISSALLIYNTIKSPWAYKRNFAMILAAFLLLVFVNAVCYSQNLPIDFSVFCYPLLAMFTCYYTVYKVPRRVLGNALKLVNESVNDATLYFDVKDKCVYKNSKAKQLFSKDGKFDEQKAVQILRKARENHADSKNLSRECFMINGEELQFEVEAEEISNEKECLGSYLKLTDKTEETQKYLTQKFFATHDELTGLYNREHFFVLCDDRIENDVGTEFLMISTNILQFKLLNELFGEEIGNEVLVNIAIAAQTFFIDDSIIGRINDDKFCCLVQAKFFNESSLEEITQAAQDVIKDSMHKVNLRIGICHVRGTEEKAQTLYDKTQLVIKKDANNYSQNYAWYDSNLMDELFREHQITSDFESSLEQGRIQMYLQPFVDITGKTSGGEALARWDHKHYGIIMPDDFIPILERAGLMHKLDTYIWRQAAKTLADWQSKKNLNLQISVNVSSKDMFYIDIPKEFEKLLKEFKFNPRNLKIEFTEEGVTNDKKNAGAIFERLKAFGFEIGIDDFGHGHSSLNMLKDINADILKMDMVLLQQDKNPERSEIILNFISQVSHALGMRLISEGVENSKQLEMLKNLGCDYYQGFLFSHPLAVDDFEKKYFEDNAIKI